MSEHPVDENTDARDGGPLTYEEMESERDRIALELYHAETRLERVREWNDSPPGNRVTLASILSALPPQEGEKQ